MPSIQVRLPGLVAHQAGDFAAKKVDFSDMIPMDRVSFMTE